MNKSIAPLSEHYRRAVDAHPPVASIKCCGKNVDTADRSCATCGKVANAILQGHHNSQSQKYRWLIYLEGDETVPIGTLTCAYCKREITTRNRQCSGCRAYYYIEFQWAYANKLDTSSPRSLELRLEAYHHFTSAEQAPPGIRISFAKPDTPNVVRKLPFDTSGLDLHVGFLKCPACANPHNARNLDDGNRCLKHRLDISAVLVRHADGKISLEHRAYEYIKQVEYQQTIAEDEEYNPTICQLECPKCDTPITDRDLKCLQCGFIVDVGYERQPIHNGSGKLIATHTAIKMMPRLWGEVDRPEGVLAIEDAPRDEDVIAEIDAARQAQEKWELYQKAKQLMRIYTYRETAEKLNMSLGRLQYLIKNPPPRPTDSNLRLCIINAYNTVGRVL